jgi:lipopolysaccharide/colanic/teichoic acid biosynthesis glycosyltransferase
MIRQSVVLLDSRWVWKNSLWSMSSLSSPRVSDALPLWKRLLDISCCILALPLLALAASWTLLLTWVASPGPIFFRQERVGHQGRRFFLYKFRTMHVSASVTCHEAHFSELMRANTPMQKLDARHDTRLIPGGWLLRALGLDELPQVINVLRGEMSIVGPRPCIPYEYMQYTASQRGRLASVPGLTGLWQVSGKNRTTFDEMVQLDITYGQNISLVKDVEIIFRTVPALWTQMSDTRKARRATESLSAPSVLGADGEQLSQSTTSLRNSQNVVGGRLEDTPRLPISPARAALMSFQPIKHASPSSPCIDRSSPQL